MASTGGSRASTWLPTIAARAWSNVYVCPDNTAHIVLEQIADELPLPGLHIADVVCREIERQGWRRVGLLGTAWTMNGPVYAQPLRRRQMERMVPPSATQRELHAAIFDELCQGVFLPATTDRFLRAIDGLRVAGAQCVILGCTEIPLIVTADNSPLPVLDSTRLLARAAVDLALDERPLDRTRGWL